MAASIDLFFSQWVHMGLSGVREFGSLSMLRTSRGWRVADVGTRCIDPGLELSA